MINWKKLKVLLKDVLRQDHVIYTVAALTTGLVAVAFAEIFTLFEGLSLDLYNSNEYLMLIATPLCFVLSSWLVINFAPGAAGSGIPQVMSSLEDVDRRKESPLIEKYLSPRVLVIKVASACACVLGGGAIGREGPTIQLGAGIFDFFARRFAGARERLNEKYWIVIGGASGLAAAFNTPLGGLVYAIEELASPEFNKFKTYLISAVIIAGFSAQSITGRYLYIGYAQIGTFEVAMFPAVMLVALLTGFLGALFGKLCGQGSGILSSMRRNKRLLLAGLAGLIVALMGILIDHNAFGSGRETFKTILFDHEVNSSFGIVLVRFFAPLISFISGVAGGIFAPALAAGGAIGGFVGGFLPNMNSSLMVVLGMIGFLAGVTRAPFTSFVLVFEMTDRHSAIFPMMITALIATYIGKLVSNKSVYTEITELMLEHKTQNIKTLDDPKPPG